MKNIFYFGEEVKGYSVKVLNEREARAGAGILFLPALLSFLYAFTFLDFKFTQIFVSFFLLDFIIRVLINPKYSPSLLLGRLFVQGQKPEYVGATQKRFAWSIGLIMAITMFFLIVLIPTITYVKVYICITCLILLYSESVFGICLGCKMYFLFNKEKAQYCPGNSCETGIKEQILKTSIFQKSIVIIAFSLLSFFVYQVI